MSSSLNCVKGHVTLRRPLLNERRKVNNMNLLIHDHIE